MGNNLKLVVDNSVKLFMICLLIVKTFPVHSTYKFLLSHAHTHKRKKTGLVGPVSV